jgi:hypothetical protein
VVRDGGGGPARSCAREKKVRWASGARVSKQGHRATAE